MTNRNLLHKDKAKEFEAWCNNKAMHVRHPPGEWNLFSVLVCIKGGYPVWANVCTNLRSDHLSLPESLVPLVKAFLKENKNVQSTEGRGIPGDEAGYLDLQSSGQSHSLPGGLGDTLHPPGSDAPF